MNRRTKYDSCHAEIAAAYKRIGWWHKSVAHHRGLGFDILTRHRDGFPVFLELKTPGGPPSSRQLTESEAALRAAFPGFFRVATTTAEALAAVGLA